MKLSIAAALLFTATAALSGGYRLDLEIHPMAPFPFLGRFGKVDVSVFPDGISGDALWLRGYCKNGESTMRVANKISRMYADIPISSLRSMLLTMSRSDEEIMPALPEFPISPTVAGGRVSGIPAKRYRVILGESWIDVWTTTAIPRHPQLDLILSTAISAVSKSAAGLLQRIPGTVVYVEMNTQRFKRVPIVRARKLVMSSEGEAEALELGRFYLKAPFADLLAR